MPQHPTDQFLQAECQRLREQLAAPRKELDELRARQQAPAAVRVPPGFLVNMGGSTWLRRLH